MMMRKDEIRESYRTAKSKKRQIGILAELNAVSEDYIKEILIEGANLRKQGESLKKTGNLKKPFRTTILSQKSLKSLSPQSRKKLQRLLFHQR